MGEKAKAFTLALESLLLRTTCTYSNYSNQRMRNMRQHFVRFASTKAASPSSSSWFSSYTPEGTMNAIMTSLAMVFAFKLVGQVTLPRSNCTR